MLWNGNSSFLLEPTSERQEERRQALKTLLAMPDLPDLCSTFKWDFSEPRSKLVTFEPKYRGIRFKIEGDLTRKLDLIVGAEQAFLRHRMVLLGQDETRIISVSRASNVQMMLFKENML